MITVPASLFLKTMVLHLRNKVWKAGSVEQMLQIGVNHEEDDVSEMWRRGERMSYQCFRDDYMLKRAELMGARYAIS